MYSETMTSLRKLNPLSSSPAILDNYKLKFDIPGMPLIEPSWASVEKCTDSQVHGVLYELTANDFDSVCRTEGVPFSYILQRCQVSLYEDVEMVTSAFTLVKSPILLMNGSTSSVAPSKSYLNVLIRGAEEYNLDEEYIQKLKSIVSNKVMIGNGIAEDMLRLSRI